jgi:hypothetical protein
MIGSFKYKNTAVSALVHTGPGLVHSITLAAAADAATLILYDNTAASGTIICKLSAVPTGTAHAVLDVSCGTGLYAAVTGTTPSATVTYAPG